MPITHTSLTQKSYGPGSQDLLHKELFLNYPDNPHPLLLLMLLTRYVSNLFGHTLSRYKYVNIFD